MTALAAITKYDIADYVNALVYVYILVIFLYILSNMLISFGARPGYSRGIDVVLGFLRDVSEPYLRIFRKFIPPLGMLDLSPILGIFVLYIIRALLYSAITS
jgi:YggT family protein